MGVRIDAHTTIQTRFVTLGGWGTIVVQYSQP